MTRMLQLTFDFDLDDDWVPLQDPPFDWTAYEAAPRADRRRLWKAHLTTYRCRDCGSATGLNQGGSNGHVCDNCAHLDECESGRYGPEGGLHHSRWGVSPHTPDEQATLTAARARRRARYRIRNQNR